MPPMTRLAQRCNS